MEKAQQRRQRGLKNMPMGGANRCQTPPPKSERTSKDGSPGGWSVELVTACPQPRRANLTTINGSVDGLGRPVDNSEQSPFSDEANNELREVLSGAYADSKPPWCFNMEGTPDCRRPASAVSTCATTTAGPTPSPTSRGATPGPDRCWSASLPEEAVVAPSPERSPDKRVQESPEGPAGVPSQGRKVFVGGIPQDMTQDELLSIFSERASVKKAWLQKYRSGASTAHHPNHHRGFGFVIFNDASAVDALLGGSFSRYLVLRDGKRLEVKRAMSSSDMQEAPRGPPEPLLKGTPQHRSGDAGSPVAQQPQAFAATFAPQMPPGQVMVPVAWQGGHQVPSMQQMQHMAYTVSCAQGVNVFRPGCQIMGMVTPGPGPAAPALPMVPAFPHGAPCAGPAPQYFLAPQGSNCQAPQYFLVNAAPPHAAGELGHFGMPQHQQQGMAYAQVQMTQMQPAPPQNGLALTAVPAQRMGEHEYWASARPHKDMAHALMKAIPDYYED